MDFLRGFATSRPLCSNCSGSTLMVTPWDTLVRQLKHEPTVVYSWRVETSDETCEFCRFIEREVELVDQDVNIDHLVASLVSWGDQWNRAIYLDIDPRTIEERTTEVHAEKRLSPRSRVPDLSTETAQEQSRREVAEELEEYNAKFAPHTDSDVCVVCHVAEALRQNGPNSLITTSIHWELVHRHFYERELEMILASHCRGNIVKPVDDSGKRNRFNTTDIRKVEIVLELNGDWPALRIQEYKRDGKLQIDSRDAPRPVTDSKLITHFRHSAKDDFVLLPGLGRNGNVQPVEKLLDPNLIQSWIQQCKANHSLCWQTHKDLFPIGLILIDSQNMRIFDVAPGDRLSYLALSYTWGVSQPVLTKDNRELWSIEGKLSEIDVPQTILDAIDLARMIGYRFLWVDALCIVQDDSAIRHHQIAQMYNIYQSAELTIVPAAGYRCSEPIPGVSLGRRVPRDGRLHNISGLPLMKFPASMKYSIEGSNWKTRGWTFQEELCSQRLLVLLPYCAMFACASSICREDVCSYVSPSPEDSQVSRDCEDSRDGLTLLSVTLRNLQDASPEQQVAWFQGLVKEYMHRTLSRDDDIENAFAGVSRMLEPLFGPSYHGVPERYFADIICGCWFWDTSSIRRKGEFPSWSWVGWIYRPEQRDLGIKAVAGKSAFLQFYRFEAGIQRLGRSSSPSEAISCDHSSVSKHLVPDEEEIQAQSMALKVNGYPLGHLIAFTTSCATLHIRQRFHQTAWDPEMTGEYHVVHPDTRTPLTSIRLPGNFVSRVGKVHRFIVIAYDESSDAFQLMLVIRPSQDSQVVERVNVTVQNRLVRADNWMSTGPQKSTFIMA